MRQKWIAMICCACLLLNGCQVAGLLDQVREETSSERESAEEPSSAQQSVREKPAGSSVSPKQPQSASSDSAPQRATDSILQNAGPDDLMAVLQNPDSEAYHSLGEAKASIDDFGFG
ncbi:hypothetical protein LJC63_13050, partial [Ruminococcaceae bacterium OttesenSCG-928-L11]|nr:hypothetical protein [Ruminococcaceae bacterium OttesenSCG-928-L11]